MITLYGIRHKATGKLMPLFKKNRGYSHWNPGSTYTHELVAKDTGIPRLLKSLKQANAVIRLWYQNPNMERSFSTYPDGDEYDYIQTRYDGRIKDDLEVVTFLLNEIVEPAEAE